MINKGRWHGVSRAGAKGDNQDAYALPRGAVGPHPAFAVIDGVSQCPRGGELARWLAGEISSWQLSSPMDLDPALARLWEDYRHLCATDAAGAELAKSYAAVSIIVFGNAQIHLRHAGDTAVDMVDPFGAGHRISGAHATPEGGLMNAFGGEEPPGWQVVAVDRRDVRHLILSSDGISGALSTDQLAELAAHHKWKHANIADEAIRLAAAKGNRDDATIVLIDCG